MSDASSRRRRLLPRLRLRTRVIGAFTIGGLILAGLLVTVTYGLGRNTLLQQREDAAEQQFVTNARTVQSQLRAEDPEITAVLQSLPLTVGGGNLVYLNGIPSGTSADASLIPTSFLEALRTSEDARRVRIDDAAGEPVMITGVRLRPPDVATRLEEVLYLEVATLSDINDTLEGLSVVLLIAYGVTVFAGAGIGVWVGGRILRPLDDISDAALSIAQGRFDTRVEGIDEPDLAGIVDSFNEMASAMQARIARDSRFASDVSHELRSPLMTIRASVDVMEHRSDELSERSQAALRLLSADIDRFEQMVQDLLDISRSDSGTMETSPVNLPELIRAAVGQHPGNAPEVVVEDAAEGQLVMGDKRRLAQVVSNYLANADRYAQGADRVLVEDRDNSLRVIVEDSGPGVSPAEQELIFERFTRGASARKRGSGDGTGLGLALVDEHVRRHRGRAWVESRPDGERGARFVFELPKAGQQ